MDVGYGINWPSIRQIALERDGRKCRFCGSDLKLKVHHIRPVLRLGTNEIWNLITLCHACHLLCHQDIREHGLCTVPGQEYDNYWFSLTDSSDVLRYADHLDSLGMNADFIRQRESQRQMQ